MVDQRAKLKQLILDAEALMQTARAESRQIVANAEHQAKELVTAARQMHEAAEAEATLAMVMGPLKFFTEITPWIILPIDSRVRAIIW